MKPEIKAANKAYSERMPLIKKRSELFFKWFVIVSSMVSVFMVYKIISSMNL